MTLSRRSLLASAVPLLAETSAPRLKIIFTGGHPGDPECGCSGTIARYTALGHEVVLLYLNRGEGFCGGGNLRDCASIRSTEARKACQILGARAAFSKQVDSRSIVDGAHYAQFAALLTAERPDVVFTHWPVDRHRDHRAVSMLTLDSWISATRKFSLYYYEVAEDTEMFPATEYVDISTVEERRRAACYAHASQRPERWYPKQVEITRARGAKSGSSQAEAFIRYSGSQPGVLP